MSLAKWIALIFIIVGLVFLASSILGEFSWKQLLFAVSLGSAGVLFLIFGNR